VLAAVEIRPIRLHDLRYSAASWPAAGLPLDIQRQLGHASIMV
jgi:integrase